MIMMIKKRWPIVIIVLILIPGGWFFFLKPGPTEKLEKVRVGVYADSISALIYIAQQQGFFKRYGLEPTIEAYQTGLYAVNDLLAGKVDLATAAEFVLALKGFEAKNLRTIGTISTTDTVEVVARKDHGIQTPGDLRGKLIGVPRKTIAEYFLNSFVSLHDIPPLSIRTVDLKPAEIVTALSEGKIDAACFFHPFSDAAKKTLAGKTVSWSTQGGHDLYLLLLTKDELIHSRPKVVIGLLKGVLEAEAFLKTHQKEAQVMVGRTLSLDPETVRNTWDKTRFRVGLDQSLLPLMEDEARWAISNHLVDAKRVPNYLPFLYWQGLEKIRPEAVGVIH
jgi:ABC-type nitrate/sulfonate/bicarbonate transport system substrate-binding protein